MKRLVVGLLAHVDSGKTTLAEGLLYRAGVLRKLGRVDHRDAFLDTDSQERARGITIFAKQAVLTLPAADGADETELTLLDTPGHVDFSAEAERALQVLDYAVLVVSGTDGVQAHTETLWKLLARYRVPTFVFVNKMDLPGADAAVRLRELRGRFGDGCVDFSAAPDPEALALCSEPLMNEVLETGAAAAETIQTAIARRQVFPVFFGAALRLDGLDGLLHGLQTLTRTPARWPEFGARVFKISEDAGTRLTWLKVTGGVLHVKDVLPGGEKADALRLYNGGKFRLVSEALPGMVVAAAGPDYLLVDGYNVIFAWDDLRKLADGNLDAARRRLMDILCNYAGYRRCVPILVFDAYKVRGGAREVEQYHNLYVVYTREAETADMYIERATHELAKEHRTRVVSSDGAEQIIVMGHGALRVSARAFEEEVRAVEKEIREFLGE